MQQPQEERGYDANRADRRPLMELLIPVTAVVIFGGAVFSAFRAFYHGREISLVDLQVAMGLATFPTGVGGLPFTLTPLGLLRA